MWDSARFTNIFLVSIFSTSPAESTSAQTQLTPTVNKIKFILLNVPQPELEPPTARFEVQILGEELESTFLVLF